MFCPAARRKSSPVMTSVHANTNPNMNRSGRLIFFFASIQFRLHLVKQFLDTAPEYSFIENNYYACPYPLKNIYRHPFKNCPHFSHSVSVAITASSFSFLASSTECMMPFVPKCLKASCLSFSDCFHASLFSVHF